MKKRVLDSQIDLNVETEAEPTIWEQDSEDEQHQGISWVMQTALKEMHRQYEVQRAARREAERKITYLESVVQQLNASLDCRAQTSLPYEFTAQSDAPAEIGESELIFTKAALETMSVKLLDSQNKYEKLEDQLQTIRASINVTFEAKEHECSELNMKIAELRTMLDIRERELAVSRKRKRLAQEEASNAKSAAAKLHTEHEDLKVTCRQLISLVEALEAAGKPVQDVDACTRLHAKYTKMKEKHRKLQARLQEV
ncbi:hypothetical protein MSAN_02257500 [Mycena sanguinolenta]|uniref:Uncharacterized protein n=1 Tax=Mycena sanguinolenta TaxID=230812 RepID=A0A8H6XA97_9AGAR|nr:hypothetical protein MSAN_02257500 [Mycena sanguinolenta]